MAEFSDYRVHFYQSTASDSQNGLIEGIGYRLTFSAMSNGLLYSFTISIIPSRRWTARVDHVKEVDAGKKYILELSSHDDEEVVGKDKQQISFTLWYPLEGSEKILLKTKKPLIETAGFNLKMDDKGKPELTSTDFENFYFKTILQVPTGLMDTQISIKGKKVHQTITMVRTPGFTSVTDLLKQTDTKNNLPVMVRCSPAS